MPRLDWFTGCRLVTAPILQTHYLLKCALGLGIGSNMAFTFNNLWPRRNGRARETSWQRGASHHLSELSGAMPYYPQSIGCYSCHLSFPSPFLCGSHQRERDEVWRGYMYINMWKIGSVWIPLLMQTSLFGGRQKCLLCTCQQGHGSLHQWHAIQKISISWRPTPLTPPLPPRVSRLHFRSWQLVITLDSRRA